MTVREWAGEHPWLFRLSIALSVCVLVEAVLLTHLRGVRESERRHHDRTATMERMATEYRSLKQRIAATRGGVPVGGNGGLSPAAVERIAREKEIAEKISATSAKNVKYGDHFVEQVISLSLVGVRREALAGFLLAVEQLDPAIRTKELRVTVNRKQPVLVDAKVKFSAYEAAAATASK